MLKSFSFYLFSNNTGTGKPLCSHSVPTLSVPAACYNHTKRLCPRPDSELIRCFLLHLEPSVAFGAMPWCHLNVSVCITCERAHTHTHGIKNTSSATSLQNPFFTQRSIVSEPKLPHQQHSKYTPHPSLPTWRQWERNPSFGRGETGISSLPSSQRGNNRRESFTNCLLIFWNGWNKVSERVREAENENDTKRERLMCLCLFFIVCCLQFVLLWNGVCEHTKCECTVCVWSVCVWMPAWLCLCVCERIHHNACWKCVENVCFVFPVFTSA